MEFHLLRAMLIHLDRQSDMDGWTWWS